MCFRSTVMRLPRADGHWIAWDSKNLQNVRPGIELAVLGVQFLCGLSVSSVEGDICASISAQ